MSNSDSWTSAIYGCTSCLRTQNAHESEACLEFLQHLETQLRLQQDGQEEGWSSTPNNQAPDWNEFRTLYEIRNNNGIHNPANGQFHTDFVVRAPNTGFHLDCRRILIRILTCQSECLALKASSLRASREWKQGAENLSVSLDRIYAALDVADTQISKWMMMMDCNDDTSNEIQSSKQDLVEDADVVEVAIESLVRGRDKFIQLGKKEEAFLLRKLEPQWASRDEVKQRMGENRWTNNPHPKGDYARMRKEFEIRHRDVRDALLLIEKMEYNLDKAKEKSMDLKSQLHGGITNVQKPSQQRHNGERPGFPLLEERVSFEDYPDPTEFGWTFTGSSQATEFFEKDNVKLDWYFTTATMKTSLQHPQKGKTQMFRKQVDPDMYRKILENPRAHTTQGYQRKNKRRPRKPRNIDS